jgi:predicted dehydrogenase
MSGQYSVVVVGMGKRGKHHASAFQANPNFKVVGICDIDKARLAAAAAELGNPATSTDAAALTAALKPDVFCFCTMPNLRTPMIRIGVDNGVKMIAFEKPVADSTKAALEVKAMLAGTGIKTVVSHQHRYGVHYRKVKEIVASGALGKVHTIYATSPGWMMHMMTHLIDYMRWYNNNVDAEWVMAQAAGRGKLKDNHPSPDYIAGVIQFANGVRGIVETGAGAPNIPEVAKWWGRNRIRVMGDDGFAEVLTNGGWRAVTKAGATAGEGSMNYAVDMPPYVQEMADWLKDERKVHSCNFDSACKGFDIMMGMCRSVVDGGQVAMPLTDGRLEIEELRQKMADKPVLLASPDHASEFGLA